MTLGNMRQLGVHNLVALIDVSSYPADTEVPWFRSRVVCAKCGARGNKIDARPNWKEQPPGDLPYRQGVAMTPERRKRVRRAILFDAIFAIVFAIVMVTIARSLFEML